MRTTLLAAISLIAVSSPATAQADGDVPELFKKAVLTPVEGPDVIALESSYTGDDVDGQMIRALVKRDGDGMALEVYEKPEDVEDSEILAELEDDIFDVWCDDFTEGFGGDLTVERDDADTAVFSFKIKPDQTADKSERKIVEKMRISVEIDKATELVSSYQLELQEPFKPVFIAKINQLTVTGECSSDELYGRPYNTRVETRVSGSAFGQSFSEHSIQTFSNLQLAQ